MSSLLSKLMTLIGASARGPRRYRKQADSSNAATSSPTAQDTVIKAHARQQTPEVRQAEQEESKRSPTTLSSPQMSRVEGPEADKSPGQELEESRVVDLLKGGES